MDPKWFPPPNRPIRAAGFVLVPFVLTCNASLLLPPGRPRALLTLPPLLYLLCQVRRTTSGVNAEDYMSAINIALLSCRYVTSVLLANPETDMHRVFVTGEKKGMREPEDPQSMGWWSKLKWSMRFWFSGRGIGWNWQVKNVDDVPANLKSKKPFIKAQLLGMLRCYIVIDLIQHYIRLIDKGPGTGTPSIDADSLSQHIVAGWLNAFRSYFDMAYGYHICSLLAVTLGLTEPALWPFWFGSFTKAYTMRNLWGYCWHQNCRILFQGPCNFVIRIFRIPRGSFLSRYLQLYLSFFISASLHHIGALNTPYVPGVTQQFLFFMLQPVAITFEDLVIDIGKRLGFASSPMTRTVGYLWVVGFLSYSLRHMASFGSQLGLDSVQNPLVPWSIADRVL